MRHLSRTNFSGSQSVYAVSPIPKAIATDKSLSVENYVSSFGQLHSEALNIILHPEPPQVPILGVSYWTDFHSYSYQWYQKTILNPSSSPLGYANAIENNQASPIYQPNIYYAQASSTDPSGEFNFSQISICEAADRLMAQQSNPFHRPSSYPGIWVEIQRNRDSGGGGTCKREQRSCNI